MTKQFGCPHDPKVICDYVNTSGMTQDKECDKCEHFVADDRVRPTGATPLLAWFIDLFRSKKAKTITIQPEDPKMYECTCTFCGKKFSSSVPGFNCCPSCYI